MKILKKMPSRKNSIVKIDIPRLVKYISKLNVQLLQVH